MPSLPRKTLACVFAALAVLLTPRGVLADPTSPSILFDTGVRLSTNELSDVGGEYSLLWMIDDDPRTTWVFESLVPSTPEVRIEVPDERTLDHLILINGNAGSAALYRMNNIIAAISTTDSSDGETVRFELGRTMERQTVLFDGTVEGSIVVSVAALIPGEKYDDTCISELDVISGGQSLLRTRGYIATDGGEYPAYDLYYDGARIAEFPADSVLEAFFIEDGAYAVFVHWAEAWSPGLTVYNLSTGLGQLLLEDVMVVPGSIAWRDGRFEGRQMNPPDGEDTPFSRPVVLP